MINEIIVREVIEKNDCAGKKYIDVTAMEEDELVSSRFRLTRAWMFPAEKLRLSSVCPMDKVTIINDHLHGDHLVVGEFINSDVDFSSRDAICKCGADLVSDGFDIYCPNLDCALTLTTRFERLGNALFFKPSLVYFDPLDGTPLFSDSRGITLSEGVNYGRPFHLITQGLFWGQPGGSLEHNLLNNKVGHVSLATFLVEPLFEEFLQQYGPPDILDNVAYELIYGFYDEMRSIVSQRDYTSEKQNLILYEFLWSLGIESLKSDYINALMTYEQVIQSPGDPMIIYAYALTHMSVLINEIGLHRLEALVVIGEVNRRRYELFDIFLHYSQNTEDMVQCFKELNTQ